MCPLVPHVKGKLGVPSDTLADECRGEDDAQSRERQAVEVCDECRGRRCRHMQREKGFVGLYTFGETHIRM